MALRGLELCPRGADMHSNACSEGSARDSPRPPAPQLHTLGGSSPIQLHFPLLSTEHLEGPPWRTPELHPQASGLYKGMFRAGVTRGHPRPPLHTASALVNAPQ